MNAKNTIITSRCLDLKNRFIEIKNKIETDSRYTNLKTICEFLPSKNLLIYDTERIYPDASEYKDRTPILFLFSNPHPVSVKTGLFLSEPHSNKFWLRLFQTDEVKLASNSEINLQSLDNWNKLKPKKLKEKLVEKLKDIMLKATYKSRFIIYLHCLYPIPTNQLGDLYRLFNKQTDLWKQIEKDSMTELAQLLKEEAIKHVVVFTNEIFQLITDATVKDVKSWRKTVKNALKDGDAKQLWAHYGSGIAKAKVDMFEGVTFYHALDTHAKDWGKKKGIELNKDKRYFTSVLDKIFENIPSAKQS
jgi:hypothetical protein